MPHHLILNKVEFHPETNMLKMTPENREVSLFSTASRCLELLITRQGSVIPQRELMAFAWTEHGLSVSPNTFYQNISSLRKALAELLPDENIIITMKRSGLTIPHDIEITLISDATIQSLPESPSSFNEKESPDSLSLTKNGDGDFYSLNHDDTSTLSIKLFWIFLWFFIIVLSTALLSKSYYFPKPQPKTLEDPFRHYTFYKKINANCSLFINPDSGKIDPGNKLINIPQSGCKGYDRVYVTLHEGTMTSSAMYCMVSHNMTTSCVSEYFVRAQK